jgi:hypothetical protein
MAGPGPARSIGAATVGKAYRGHDMSILMAGGLCGRPVARELACLEHLGDAHGRAAAWVRRSGRGRIGGGRLGLGRWWSDVEQLAGEREVVGLHAAPQQTVVADAMKARRPSPGRQWRTVPPDCRFVVLTAALTIEWRRM